MTTVKHVYVAIAAITKALSHEGIAKNRKNQQQGFSFRGIDDVQNALAPLLAEHSLCIIPRVRERLVTERETKSGSVMFGVTVLVDFDFVSAVDGSTHTATMYGEAMDSGDKATNKAMSAAYKYMALEVFCIPTEGDNDADAKTPEPLVAKRSEEQAAHRSESREVSGRPASLPKGFNLAGQPVAIFAKPESPLAGQTLDRLTDQQLADMYLLAAKKEGYTAWREAAEAEQARRVRAVPMSEKPKALADTDEDREIAERIGA